MVFVIIFLILGSIFGAIGVAVARNKGVDGLIGFFLGAFLGPLGLIVVALLNPTLPSSPEASDPHLNDPPCPRDLSLDGYRLWLATRYDISRNTVFDCFVFNNQTFPDLDGALAAAHTEEQIALNQAKADKMRREAEIQIAREAYDLAQAKENARIRRIAPWVLAAISAIGVSIAGYAFLIPSESEKMEALRDAQMAEARWLEQVHIPKHLRPHAKLSSTDFDGMPTYKCGGYNQVILLTFELDTAGIAIARDYISRMKGSVVAPLQGTDRAHLLLPGSEGVIAAIGELATGSDNLMTVCRYRV